MGQPDKPVYHAFTQEYPAKRNRLLTEIELTNPLNNSVVKGIALWDTGATSSCISDSVAGKLDLKPTGMMNIKTPSGSKEVRTFLVNIKLPNYLSVVDVPVCETDIGNQDIDVLIGMDIILLGDFSVSIFNDRTVFSFRHPSKATTDYVKQLKVEDVVALDTAMERKSGSKIKNDFPPPHRGGNFYSICKPLYNLAIIL